MTKSEKEFNEERERALRFYGSERGRYITSQAFYRAIQAMEQDEYPEQSNIEDMKYLMENLFPIFPAIAEVVRAHNEKHNANCITCISFGEECCVDPEDYKTPCSYYVKRGAK
jgi:hypothetical protein